MFFPIEKSAASVALYCIAFCWVIFTSTHFASKQKHVWIFRFIRAWQIISLCQKCERNRNSWYAAMNVIAYAVEAFLRILNNVNAKNIFFDIDKNKLPHMQIAANISREQWGKNCYWNIKTRSLKKTFIIDCINSFLPQKLLTNHIIFE